LTQGPYSTAFVEHMVTIVDVLGENLTLVKDVQKSLNDFFGKVSTFYSCMLLTSYFCRTSNEWAVPYS
jgi:hypothetical protein